MLHRLSVCASALALSLGCLQLAPARDVEAEELLARLDEANKPEPGPDRSAPVWQHPGWEGLNGDGSSSRSAVPRVCGGTPWGHGELTSAEREVERDLTAATAGRGPTHTYQKFARWREAWAVYDGFDCADEWGGKWERDRFDNIWSGLERRERERLTFAEAREAREAFARLYQEHWEVELARAAKARGFAEARVGLRYFLNHVRSEGWPSERLGSVAVLLGGGDRFDIDQVTRRQALIIDDDLTLLIPATSRTYQGTDLSSLTRTVRVTGTTVYQAVLGPQQAFLVEPIADIDEGVDARAALAAVRAVAAGGSVAIADYSGGRAAQCVELDPGKLSGMLTPQFGNAIATLVTTVDDAIIALPSCSAFSADPVTRCALPSGRVTVTYAEIGEDALTGESGCQQLGGQWQRMATAVRIPR